jgi:gamma-glutamyltranspeptidase/glutathione hydrolase
LSSTTPPPARHPEAPLSVSSSSDQAVAVTTHHLATRAAVETMRSGGNAVDAAVAANAVVGVVRPDTCGPGGDLFALVHAPGQPRPFALNASGRAGSKVDAASLRRAGRDTIPARSTHTITVPGCVDGWIALLDRHGTQSLHDVLATAIAIADDGFEVPTELAGSLDVLAPLIGGEASARSLYPNGVAPAAGTVIRRPDLAATLRLLAEGGRDAFYLGDVGRGIVAATDGGVIADDLAVDQADWVEPLGMRVFGLDAWTIPPNSQGHLVLTAGWLAERLPAPRDPADGSWHHALIEAYRAVAWERDLVTTDPDTAPLAPDDLVSPARLEARLTRIGDRPVSWPASRTVPGGTTYLCVRDGAGLGVSLIQSNFHGIGTGRGAGATGVFLHDRGAGFTLEQGHRNELVPGRRPLHTLAPTLWTEGGSLRMILGTRGGQYQPQLLLQVAAHRRLAGLDASAAMAFPRWIVDHWGPDETHRVSVESRMPDGVVDELSARGHIVARTAPWERGWGPVALIEHDGASVTACGDPRVSTSGAEAL